jgi:hypothetical protein
MAIASVDVEVLRKIVERYGVEQTLSVLAAICDDKASDLAHAKQSATAGKPWARAATMIELSVATNHGHWPE